MKAFFTKISAILMAVVVLMSTMSFAINKHYCMDMLVDVSVVLPASSCGMDMYVPDMEKAPQITTSSCCQDEHIVIEGQDEVKPSAEWSADHMEMAAVIFMESYHMLFTEEAQEANPFPAYSPPLLVKDLPVFYETYLI